jgi:hypothetical protein
MIALPVIPENTSASDLFPAATVVYSYENGTGYVRVSNSENLTVGRGYWILLNEEKTYTLTGPPFYSHTQKVSEIGWAMIGGCTDPALVIPHNCDSRVIYGYTQGIGYQRVTGSLERGKGYWILLDDVMDEAEILVKAITANGE